MSLLVLVICIGWSQLAQTQVISRNTDGEVVVTYKDGSWRYFMSTDSLILRSEYENFKASERAPAVATPIIVDEPVEDINPTSPETGEEMDTSNMTDMTTPPMETEVPRNLTVDESEILELTERRLTLTERLRRVESGYIQLTEKEIRKVREELAEINTKLNTDVAMSTDEVIPSDARALKSPRVYNRADYTFKPNTRSVKNDCDVVVERDEFTNKKRAATSREYLFQYTPEEMRKFLKGGHYLDGYASVANMSGNIILSIHSEINSRSPESGYGSLQKNAAIRLKLSNNEVVTLFNSRQDPGRRVVTENKFYYTGRYSIDRDALKKLKKYDVYSIRISWSAGYEDYDVYHVDVLRNQLNCVEKAF